MPNITIKSGKTGYWWIINGAPNASTTLFWTGSLLTLHIPIYSFNPNEAAQFENRKSAEFQAKILIGANSWRAEQHLWR